MTTVTSAKTDYCKRNPDRPVSECPWEEQSAVRSDWHPDSVTGHTECAECGETAFFARKAGPGDPKHRKPTQAERLHDALLRGPVDPLQAWQDLGIYRLAARVHDLRAYGIPVKRRDKVIRNRYCEPVTVAEYYLETSA